MRKVNDELLMKPDYLMYLLVAGMLVVIIVFAYFWYKELKYNGCSKPKRYIIALLVIGGSFVCFMFYMTFKDVQTVKKYGEQRTKYTVYVDGDIVDYENVYLGGYDLHFADEEQKIIATTKR